MMLSKPAIHAVTWRLPALILATSAGVIPIMAVVAPLGLAPMLIGMALAAIVFGPRTDLWNARPHLIGYLSLVLLVLGSVSSLWAIHPTASMSKAIQLAPLFLAGMVLLMVSRAAPSEVRARIADALAVGVFLALAILLIEALTGTPLSRLLARPPVDETLLLQRYNRAGTILAILLWPAMLRVQRRHGLKYAIGGMAFGVVVLASLESRTAFIAVAAGVAFLLLSLLWSRRAAFLTAAVALALSVLLPFALPRLVLERPDVDTIRMEASQLKILSGFHRLRIWHFTADRIAERPWLGWGLNASRDLPGGHEPTDAAGTVLPLHPHNALLQLTVELGSVGGLLGIGLLIAVLVLSGRCEKEPLTAGVTLAAFVAGLVVASLSYGIWQSWWIAGLWLSGALTVFATGDTEAAQTAQPA